MSIRHWFFVGIDISKDYSSAQGLDREGKRLFYLEFAMNDEGFSEFLKALKTRGEDLSGVTVGMDSSGCYHFNLFAFLCSEGMICVVINPLLISNFARLSLGKTKTDKKDTLTIAQFLLANGSKPSQVSYFQNSQDLKDLARERESLAVMITGLGNDVRRLHITKDVVSRFSGDNGSNRKKPLLLMLCTYFLFLDLQKKARTYHGRLASFEK